MEARSSSPQAVVTKVLGFVIAMAAGFLGGTFAPALDIGSSLGALVGFADATILPGPINVGAYALVGMGEARIERCVVLDREGVARGFVSPSDLVRARFREHRENGDDTLS